VEDRKQAVLLWFFLCRRRWAVDGWQQQVFAQPLPSLVPLPPQVAATVLTELNETGHDACITFHSRTEPSTATGL
jgi:hypothetical protein